MQKNVSNEYRPDAIIVSVHKQNKIKVIKKQAIACFFCFRKVAVAN
jgi:hypothetical protein